MTLEEVKQKLKVFDKYTFEEDTHTYYCNGKKVGIGVTSLIGLYANKFDEQKIAEMVANSNQKKINDIYRNPLIEHEDIEYASTLETDVSKIIEEWHYKRDFSCEKGTTIHEYTQSLFSGNEWHLRPFDSSKEYLEVVEKIKHHSNNYYNDYKDRYIHIKDELLIGVEWADISSAIDHLFYDKVDKGVVIVDYKTNSYMEGYFNNPDKKVYKKYMMIPFQDTLDNAYEHYKIQLSIYKYILQELLGIPVLRTEIVYLTENKDNYEVIQIPYEKEKAELMLKLRGESKMKIAIIMGQSGTGKTYSFKNLPAKETAIISVAKTDLPFYNKNDIPFIQSEDYEAIKNTIKNIDKKIIIVDDASFLTQFETLKKAMQGSEFGKKENGIAKNFYELLQISRSNDVKNKENKILYITMHERKNDAGIIAPKTCGNSVDDRINVEGQVNILFRSMKKDNEYVFQTQNGSDSVCKTPEDMFSEEFIPNDLWAIDKRIREYYKMKPIEIEEKKVEEIK